MTNWIIGIVSAVLAAVLFYAAAATTGSGAPQTPMILLLLSAVAVLGVFFAIARGIRSVTPHAPDATPHTAAAGSRVEVDADPSGNHPWAGWGRTLGVMAVGLAGLLFYVLVYVGSFAGFMTWMIYPALFLTATLLVVVVLLTSGKA